MMTPRERAAAIVARYHELADAHDRRALGRQSDVADRMRTEADLRQAALERGDIPVPKSGRGS